MLYVALSLTLLLLYLANRLVGRSPRAGTVLAVLTLVAMLGPMVVGMVLPPVILEACLLWGAVVLWRALGGSRWIFLPLSLGATAIAFGATSLVAVRHEREIARLRERYPYESMERRIAMRQNNEYERMLINYPLQSMQSRVPVAEREAIPAPISRPAGSDGRLARLEAKIDQAVRGYRSVQLRMLHESEVNRFTNSPGFGVSRIMPPTARGLASGLRKRPVPPQPGSRPNAEWSPGDMRPPSDDDAERLGDVLDQSIVDFVNPDGFGYVKDRRHVAGFDEHRFSKVPEPNQKWKVQTIELVSLLLHDEPQVYDSAELPRMTRNRSIPTRPLDRFEQFALGVLQQGEDLFITETDDGIRMVGAIRSTRQCVECHGGERGDLLGAFSYSLRRAE